MMSNAGVIQPGSSSLYSDRSLTTVLLCIHSASKYSADAAVPVSLVGRWQHVHTPAQIIIIIIITIYVMRVVRGHVLSFGANIII